MVESEGQKALWERALDSRAVKLVLAPLLVVVVGFFVVRGIEGCDEPPPGPDVRIDAAASSVNPEGDEDPAAEYVCLVNEGEEAVSLTGWKLTDAEGIVNSLPQFSLAPRATVRVHPGGGESLADTSHDLYGGKGASWNNGGDTISLFDADGVEVDSRVYPERDDGEVRGTCGPPLPEDISDPANSG